ncbi:BTAD domain-containing putative transcriptional regulator [Fimbriimonas ginsengisoli]|uniref:Transcriptional activator n=1 Tax=Fimbriimonas ginsengisoli Gsoil 348 TaxID=661478 RepID=A0A068NQR9_FIMGI|nr:BTAD domain-containing putative transcriptional regulator [Fimbriimonas ginsengisoli]AIE85791.1 transcriptional activator [Fimbriimonas ginsengisoli Gsoil 348]
MSTTWRIRQFGSVAIEGPAFDAGRSTLFSTQRSAKILSLLALVRNGQMRREDLADALWPDDFYDATRLRLRKELSRLRQALGPAADALEGDSDTIGLKLSAFTTDLQLLRRSLELTQGDSSREVRLREAAEAADGPFLPGWEDPWVVAERHAAEGLKCQVLVALAQILLDKGSPEEALSTIGFVIENDPGQEAARLVAVRAHAALGTPASAVTEFQSMKRAMRKQNVGSPSVEAEALFTQVQEGSLKPFETPRLPTLTAPLDRFFGRLDEMVTIAKHLAPDGDGRLMSLVGPGGMGKTRLSREAALGLSGAYRGNVAFVSLAGSPSPESAAATLLAQLGWQGAATAEPAAVVAASLPPGPCLLVMDNLEHLMPQSAELVRQLLEACPSLRILATSRQSLRIAGERILALGPLGEEAGAMLADLARWERPELQNDPDLAELARRLDGIPLALRLAAPRLRLLGPRALLERLGDRFRLLQGGANDLPERHRSLRAAFDGSFEALGDRERRALIQMSPFRGGWTLSQVERVLPRDDALEAMEALVDASFVSVDDRGSTMRFTMLETVREYVTSREETGEARIAFVRAMASEISELLPDTLTPRRLSLLETLDAESDNLHLAVELGIQNDPDSVQKILSRLWIYDTTRGRHAELERLYRDFDLVCPLTELDAAAEFGKGMALAGLNRMRQATESFAKAAKDYQLSGDFANAALVEAMRLVTARHVLRTPFDDVLVQLQPLAAQAGEVPAVAGRFAMLEGDLLFFGGRLQEAASRIDEAIAIAEALGDEVGLVAAVHYRGFVSIELGEHAATKRSLVRIAPTVDRLSDPRRRGVQQELLGKAAIGLGFLPEALANFQQARAEWSRLRNAYQLADQDNSIARTLLALGRADEAKAAAHEAFRAWSSYDDFRGISTSLHTLAAIRLEQRDLIGAGKALSSARGLAKEQGIEFSHLESAYLDGLTRRVDSTPGTTDDLGALFDS